MGYTKHEEFLKDLQLEDMATDHLSLQQEEETEDAEIVKWRNKLKRNMEIMEALGWNLDEEEESGEDVKDFDWDSCNWDDEDYILDEEDVDYEYDYKIEEKTELAITDLTFRKRTV